MPELLVRQKKNADGSAALSCARADGSVTWQRQPGKNGRFFPLHDLTHYAVETVLGHRRGFYGMVADGWDLSDFGAPWPKGRIPADADLAELIVGYLDVERATGERLTGAQLSDNARSYFEQRGIAGDCRVSDEQLAQIRAMRSELFARWDALPAGATLELAFDRA